MSLYNALTELRSSDLHNPPASVLSRPRATRKRVDRAHTQIAMVMKSLLFAMLLHAAASDVPPPLPRLRGTAQRNSSDVNGTGHESASPDDIIQRAAASNQFNPGPHPEFHEPLPFSRRVSSDEPKTGSRFQRRASAFTTGRPRQNAPSRTRNLANSAALDPPWPPNATSGTTRDCLHHRSSSSTTRPTPIPKANPCPKPYVKYGKFCCFGKPMEGNCYKWDD